jgi:DNA-binding transcriptional LysR family regulator
MEVQLHQMRALVAVLDAGTFTEAAAALGVSQAAVSRAVAGLEEALGARLLQRTSRHVSLTGVGARVAERVRLVLEEIDGIHRVVAESRTELRVGYAWAALGKYTRRLQKTWARAHPAVPLVFVQTQSATAGLAEGVADVAVVRRELRDRRFAAELIGTEARVAAVSTDNPMARRRSVALADLVRYTVAIDSRTGTTSARMWHGGASPRDFRETHGVDEWLTLIAANQAVGITSEATANQNPRPGVAYRALRDAERIPVWLAWWRDDPPAHLPELIALVAESYAT